VTNEEVMKDEAGTAKEETENSNADVTGSLNYNEEQEGEREEK
jgi:hypothetical protein